MSLKKKELNRAVQAAVEADFGYGLSLDKIDAVIKSYGTVVANTLSNGDEVRLDYVGLFKPVLFKATRGRNLQTGATVDIPATYRVRFKAVPTLKKSVKALPVTECATGNCPV